MSLYPLKFIPILKEVIWGGSEICKFKSLEPLQNKIGESWEISGVDQSISTVENGPLGGRNLQDLINTFKEKIVGKKNYKKFGSKFPLLIKFIDAKEDLSIQVHPNDKLSMERHNSLGKTEMWYVIDSEKDAFLYSGFEKLLDPKDYTKSIQDNTFIDYLLKHDVKKGDSFFLPAGRVHSIGAGTFLTEIQQTSDITYRIYDYNRKDINGKSRELHTELAKDAIDFNIYNNYRIEYKHQKNLPVRLESCEYFTTNLLEFNREITLERGKEDSFIIYICIGGKCNITDAKNNKITLEKGETILIPAINTGSIKIEPNKSVQLLETYIV